MRPGRNGFRRRDCRCCMVTDTAYLRNPNYHGPNDTWQTLDYRRMAQVVQAVYAVTQHAN